MDNRNPTGVTCALPAFQIKTRSFPEHPFLKFGRNTADGKSYRSPTVFCRKLRMKRMVVDRTPAIKTVLMLFPPSGMVMEISDGNEYGHIAITLSYAYRYLLHTLTEFEDRQYLLSETDQGPSVEEYPQARYTGFFGGSLSFDHHSHDWEAFKVQLTQFCVANGVTDENDKISGVGALSHYGAHRRHNASGVKSGST
ncbi:hypothetical protein EVAR_21002_1 [Eumeta japonica]|uniref:Uncharacterized protein n=1 Tax=Eumeta variegata TaxID=151549 RepID=A0A4C1V527_EUMVA|nr:hypothetical protein EVAR_21002_1 [Eumeta japonica]